MDSFEYFDYKPFILTWKIHNFTEGWRFIDEYFFSPTFTIPLTNDSFRLVLFKNCNAKEYLSLYVHFISNERKSENSYFFHLSVNGHGYNERSCKTFRKNFDYWGAAQFVKRKSLLENNEVRSKETMTVCCRICMEVEYGKPQSIYSLKKTLEKIYEKEKRYPSENNLLYKKSKVKCHQKNLMTPEKSFKVPVLHEWFEHLYSEKVGFTSFHSFASLNEYAKLIKGSCPSSLPKSLLSHSYLPTERANVTWYIKKFSHLKHDEKIFSPSIRCGSNTWKLLFDLSTNNNGKEVATISVCPMSLYMNSKKIVRCKICVVDESGRLPLSVESIHLYNNDGQWKVPSFIETEMLENNKKSYLSNDILILFISLSVSEDRYKHDPSWTVTETYDDEYLSQYYFIRSFRPLCDNMRDILKSGLYSDVTLKAGQYEVNAHTSILSERSSEFKRRIKILSKSSANEKMTLEITDLDEKHLKELLEYIYSGHCSTYYSSCFISAALNYGIDEEIMIKKANFSFAVIFFYCCKDENLKKLDDWRHKEILYRELDVLRLFDDYCADTL